MVDNRTITPGGFNYTGLRDKTVITLLAKFGKTEVLSVPGGDPAEPWDPKPNATDHDVTVVKKKLRLVNRAGTVIEDAKLLLLVSTDGAPEPTLECTLTYNNEPFSVLHVDPLQPGSVTMLWEVWCGK